MPLLNSFSKLKYEAGCDEAGRGCLAGPVVAAAVILPPDFFHPWLNDSKQVSPHRRWKLREIIEKEALSFSIGIVEAHEIDQINILNASIKAMHLALDKLQLPTQYILVDGNQFHPYQDIPYRTIPKGDALYTSIAAASILAKTYRDELMIKLSSSFPVYKWDRNKGYPTQEHIDAILQFGYSQHHRKTFHFTRQLKLVFDEH